MLYTWRIDKKSKYAYMPTREGFFVTEQQRDHVAEVYAKFPALRKIMGDTLIWANLC